MGFGTYQLPDGTLVSYFHDACGMEEAAWTRMTAELEYRYEAQMREEVLNELARATDNWDPNRCDPRNVRREFGDRQVVNLGMRVNKVIKGARRRLAYAAALAAICLALPGCVIKMPEGGTGSRGCGDRDEVDERWDAYERPVDRPADWPVYHHPSRSKKE